MAADWQKNKRPEPNECFYNAQLFCHGHPEVRYFEGYLWIAGLPLHHAWNLLPDGIHIDFTVEAMERKLTPEQRAVDPREPLYCGVEVPRAHVRTRMLDAGATEPLAELYMALVKKKRPTDIAKANSAD